VAAMVAKRNGAAHHGALQTQGAPGTPPG